MSLYITSLNSGSNGNCYYIGNDHEAVLVDAGISCRETEIRMARLGLSMQKVKAVFISHEHTDHIRGVRVLSNKYRLPVYITEDTVKGGRLKLDRALVKSFNAYEAIQVGGLSVVPFPKMHDAADPYSFTVEGNEIKIGVFTDIGTPCSNLAAHFKQCHAAFLEANYDDEMLENGNYPWHLKNRIRGGNGHLSNTQALALFKEHKPAFMTHLVLSHLSKNNNCPKLVYETFSRHADGRHIIVASRYEETALYKICNTNDKEEHTLLQTTHHKKPVQASLF